MSVAEKGRPWSQPVDSENHSGSELMHDVQIPLVRGEVIRG